jgi:hypothetical protein
VQRAAAGCHGSSDAYRRQARRLRCRYAGHPGRLQHSLKRLATGDTPSSPTGPALAPQATQPPPYPASAQTGAARRFADYLSAQATGTSVLRYSQRLELLRAARRLGVGRFEANLLIAAVLERRRSRTAEPVDAGGLPVAAQLATFLLVQGALLFGTWWVVLR